MNDAHLRDLLSGLRRASAAADALACGGLNEGRVVCDLKKAKQSLFVAMLEVVAAYSKFKEAHDH